VVGVDAGNAVTPSTGPPTSDGVLYILHMGDETILTVRKNRIGPLISDDKVQLQHDEMVEEFNRYFTSVFTKENTADSLGSTTIPKQRIREVM